MGMTPVQVPDEQMKDFKIILHDDDLTELDAAFQGRDERTGVAFVKVKESRSWTPLKFRDAPLNVADRVYSVGLMPKDAAYKPYLTSTSVAALLRGPVPQILVNAEGLGPIGSPVFNSDGEAVGLVNTQSDQSPILNDPRNPNAAVNDPPRYFTPARDFLLSLGDPPVAGSPIRMPSVGIASLSGLKKEVAEYFGIKDQPAVQIGDVIPNFPADKAGLKSGDVIVKTNGQPLERGDQPEETPLIMTRKLARLKVGDTVTFSILRGKGTPLQDIKVTLQERPKPANKAPRFWAEDLGFSTRELVFEDTYVRRLPADTKGVMVVLVKPSSSAQTAKLAPGDLVTRMNQNAVESLDQFKKDYEQFRKEKPKEAVVLEVLRGVNTQVIRIEPPQ
jgi:serine protease Do